MLRIISLFTLCWFLCATMQAQNPDCTPKDYERLMAEAKRLAQSGEYDKAINKLQSAKTCQPQREVEVNKEVLRVFEKVNGERKRAEEQTKIAKAEKEKAEAEARRVYANDLAYKSQQALKDGNRSAACCLAILAHQFVDDKNIAVQQALIDAAYFNDNPNNAPLSLSSVFEGFQDWVQFSPDGRTIAAQSSDKILILDWQSGKETARFCTEHSDIQCFEFSPDGKQLAIAIDELALIWDIGSRKTIANLLEHTEKINSLSYSPDGKRLATASKDKTAIIWDLEKKKPILKMEGHTAEIYIIKYAPNGKTLATGSRDNTAKIWDAQSGALIATLKNHESEIRTLAYAPNGEKLATGSTEIIVWNTQSWLPELTLSGIVFSSCLAFSPDGYKLASGSVDHTIKIWRLKSKELETVLTGHAELVNCIVFAPDGLTLASVSRDNSMRIWSLTPGQFGRSFSRSSTKARSLASAQNSAILATGYADGAVDVFDLQSGKEFHHVSPDKPSPANVALSPDGKQLAIGYSEKLILCDAITQEEKLIAKGDFWEEIAFSPDAMQLANVAGDIVNIWDVQTGKLNSTLAGHDWTTTSVAFSPDGKTVATGAIDYQAIIWDVKSGQKIKTFRHLVAVNDVAFSPAGTQLAVCLSDKTVVIYDLKTGDTSMTIDGGSIGEITSIAFSPNGKRLLATIDDLVKIWNLDSGEAEIALSGHLGTVNNALFSPDGNKVITCADDGKTMIWHIHPDSIIHQWQIHHNQTLLTFSDLKRFNLKALINQKPNNESQLIAYHEPEQIKAFADLEASLVWESSVFSAMESHFLRAERLYNAVLQLQDEAFLRKYIPQLERWASICKSNGQMDKAIVLEQKVKQLKAK